MRVVTADEAVAGIQSGHRVFVHGGAAVPPCWSPPWSPGPASCGTWSSSTAISWGRPPTWRRSWPAASATGRSSSAPTCARRCRPGGRTSSPSSSRTSPRCSAPGGSPWTWPCSTSRRRTPTASARSAPRSTWRGGGARRPDGGRPAQPGDAPQPGRLLRPRRPLRRHARRRRAAAGGRRGRRPPPSGHRGPRGRAGRGRGDAAAGHRGHPRTPCCALRGHRDLGVHTEMFSDGVVDLVEAGVITGARSRSTAGKVVAPSSSAAAAVRLRPRQPDGRAAPLRLHERHRRDPPPPAMTAINSALQIDLTGQVCADSLGPALQRRRRPDGLHARGRPPAEGGMPIIALPATAPAARSRASSPSWRAGAGVTTTRAHVHRGHRVRRRRPVRTSLRERAAALIAHRAPTSATTSHVRHDASTTSERRPGTRRSSASGIGLGTSGPSVRAGRQWRSSAYGMA